MKIFLTGATGFLGQCVAKTLQSQNHTVRVLVRKNSDKEKLEKLGLEAVIGNLENFSAAWLAGIDAVYHFAAIRYEWGFSWKEYKQSNIEGTEKLLQAAVKNKVGRFIYCSTAFVHGYPKNTLITEVSPYAPSSLYAKSKLEAEKIVLRYAHEQGLFSIIIRPSMVYGPEDTHGMFMKLCRLIKSGKFIIIGNGRNCIHLSYIDDIVAGFLQALDHGASGEAYLLASAGPISLTDLVSLAGRELQVGQLPLKIPFLLAKVAGFLAEIIYATGQKIGLKYFFREPFITRSKVDIIGGNQHFDATKASEELGFIPKIGYPEGIRKTIKWYKSNGYL